MATAYLASTAITGVLLLAVVVYVARHYPWRQWVAQPSFGAAEESDQGAPVAALLLGALVVVALGTGVGVGVTGSVGLPGAFTGFFGGLLALYVTWGSYHICRSRGLHYGQAVGVGVWLLGLVFLLGIVVKLLLSG